ncbi:hypothetical protein CDL15_Pgr003402 [Punica granatum]|uniref:Autophagy-related protein 2 n=1 Tax=Punica granatum TaxID=22663 RepID=A0A218X3H2_PUNGR|nr:hypothetical protein CDL15_Pgr003402 [Punica granatum]
MFPWSIAKSAEAMFSRWAVKRVCKFLLKKKLGQFILGDIDLDQLDVQLTEGTIQLTDLALNVDFLNDKLSEAASLYIKEGSIGSLLVRMPWKGKGCQVELDEFEVVLAPCVQSSSSNRDKTGNFSAAANQSINQGHGEHEKEMFENVSTSPGDLHEGVKIIAKMVKWLLTSFNVKIKKLIVAFDPDSQTSTNGFLNHKTLVLRITEIECGTCGSENGNLGGAEGGDSFLGISRLTSYVTFQGAVLELIQVDDVSRQTALNMTGADSFEAPLNLFPASAGSRIMTGNRGGFSGNLKLSIPWKNGSLDIRKVDAEVSIDPIELRFQPSTIKWLLCLWETLKNLGKDEKSHLHMKSSDNVPSTSSSHRSSPTSVSPEDSGDDIVLMHGGLPAEPSSLMGQESAYDMKLPCVISDWVPATVNKDEPDFGASVDQFFECFDVMRNSQSAIGASGMWNWTCSVFSAITAASSLASGSLHISSEQQHVETNLNTAVAGISLIFSFHDEDELHTSGLHCYQEKIDSYLHYIVLDSSDIHLALQVCPRELKFEGTVKCIELEHCISLRENGSDFVHQHGFHESSGQTAAIKQLQDEVQRALPQRATFFGIPDHRPTSTSSQKGPIRNKVDIIRIALLKTSGGLNCQFTVKSGLQNDMSDGAISFSVKLPPFVFWVDFSLMIKLFTFMEKVQGFAESSDAGVRSLCKVKQPSHENAKRVPARPQRGNSETRFMALSSEERLRGTISVPHGRVLLCFPFHAEDDLLGYSTCNEFIALDFCSPLSTSKDKSCPFPDADVEKRFSVRSTRSLYLNFGNLDVYLVRTVSEYGDVEISSSHMLGKKFFSEDIISAAGHSSIHLIWQDSPVTDPGLADNTKSFAWSQESKNRNRFTGKGHDFASVTTVNRFEDSSSLIRQQIVLSADFLLHAHLAPVVINLGRSQYEGMHSLLNQMNEGLSCGSSGASAAKEESSVHQRTVLVECDSLEIVIKPEKLANDKSSMLSELPGSWSRLKLKVKKFELLDVSNIGGNHGANFFWLSHREGKLWGSLSSVSDRDFLLISCTDSTMKRGDGEGSNALSSGLAGSDIIHLWEPRSSHGYTSIFLKCATIVASGGRLDWFDSITSFFSLSSSETEKSSSSEPDGQAFSGFSFALNLVDSCLSYEPYLKNLVVEGAVAEDYVACLLAASSLDLSTAVGTVDDYSIRVQDLGLLLCSASELELLDGTYDAQHLCKLGYVKVAHEALVEAKVRTNSQSEMPWQLECSDSQIDVETCGDTTMGLIKLATQLQQLLAPDVEESLVHLQTRWNNLQKGDDIDSSYGLIVGECDANLVNPQVRTTSASLANEPVKMCLMDEIREDAFLVGEVQIGQDYSESQLSAMPEESLLVDACQYYSESPEVVSSPSLSFGGRMPLGGSECCQAPELQNDFFPEFIEGYCLSDLRSLSELNVTSRSSGETIKSTNSENVGVVGEKSGWYQDTSLMIVEDHISETSDLSSSRQSVQGDFSNPGSGNSDDSVAIGRVLLENINVKWRMYAGSDWGDTRKNNEHPKKVSGRDKFVCMELILSGVDCQYDIYPFGEFYASKLSLSFKDFHLYDKTLDAPLKLVLGYYHSKHHPRESSSKAFKVELEAVRPDPSIPLEEYRFVSGFNTMFLVQKFDVRPLLVRVDYIPERVDLAALSGGKYVELMNLVPWKGVELQLKHVHAVGIYGWGNIHKVLHGIPTVRSLVSVGKAAAKLVSCPVENYRKDHRVLKGVQRGMFAFLRSISLEAVGLGVHLAAGAHDMLLQAEYVLASLPPYAPWPGQSGKKPNVRSNQPKDAQQGIQKAYESLSDGLGKSASALVQTPIKKYQRGAGAGAAIATAFKAVPAATIAPVSACASAFHYALLGLRNSLDPEHKKESMEKYMGPDPQQ